ncbi:large ribosomal subunit protein bL32m [Ambystoma mexicanum]|uniref:large ribosomal subunit protein bL32m n=1 Tax=Ambystoma mexicanum TaxID=8296 RepID=UPI0037E93B34
MVSVLQPAMRLLQLMRRGALEAELRILHGLGLYRPSEPAVALQVAIVKPWPEGVVPEPDDTPSFLDSILWMAAPKSRRTIEVNRCRRRNPNKLIKLKTNIDVCPECGHLKQKHVLCGFCYEKVHKETFKIREEIRLKEGGHFNVAIVETSVLYEGEKPTEKDEGNRIIERNRKRPSWFTIN